MLEVGGLEYTPDIMHSSIDIVLFKFLQHGRPNVKCEQELHDIAINCNNVAVSTTMNWAY